MSKTDKARKIAVNLDGVNGLNEEVVSLSDIIIFSPSEYTEKSISEFFAAAKSLKGKAQFYLRLPVTANGEDIAILKKRVHACLPDGLYIENFYGLALATEFDLPFIAGTGRNIYNSESAKYILSRGGEFVYSAELTLSEIENMEKKHALNGFIFVHGDMRAMTLCHCPFQLAHGNNCASCTYKEGLQYEDEKGYRFPLKRIKVSRCYFELYNSAKLSSIKRLRGKDINFYFTLFGMPAAAVCDIIKGYLGIINTEDSPQGKFTSGHLFKGVT